MSNWDEVVATVPRRSFIPPLIWADLGPGPWTRIDQADSPDEWEAAVSANCPLVTQMDDGAADGPGLASSSASMPSLVVEFLNLLDVQDHDRVLEIGTGTGWTAALLSARLGEQNVTSIEVDPTVAKQAAANLEAAGYAPALIVGDGASIRPEGSPFDRVHVTCAVATLPYAWVEQTRPGGVVVCPYSAGFGFGQRLRLDVLPNGTAVGRFSGSASYMLLRSQRTASGREEQWTSGTTPAVSRTRLDPRVVRYAPIAADLVISILVPGVVSRIYTDDDGATFWVLDSASHRGPWASVDYEHGQPDYEVQQAGERSLWDEVEAAYFRWVSWGRPDISRFGMTVTPEGHRIWLDDPSRVIRPE